jgi:hypothetical protein
MIFLHVAGPVANGSRPSLAKAVEAGSQALGGQRIE